MRRKRKSHKVQVGGGGPHIQASGIVRSPDPLGSLDRNDGTAQMQLSRGPEATETANEIIQRVHDAMRLRRPDKDIRELARLVKTFPELVLREPEFVGFLHYLHETEQTAALNRILDVRGRGRPAKDHLPVVSFVLNVAKVENCSVNKAAKLVVEHHGGRFCMSAASLENAVSQHRHLYELHAQPRFASGKTLTNRPFERPE